MTTNYIARGSLSRRIQITGQHATCFVGCTDDIAFQFNFDKMTRRCDVFTFTIGQRKKVVVDWFQIKTLYLPFEGKRFRTSSTLSHFNYVH